MKGTLFLACVLSLLLGSAQSLQISTDRCPELKTDAECTGDKDCGWCSRPIRYKDGTLGPHCVGLNGSSSMPFVCTGTFSTHEHPVQHPNPSVKQSQTVNCPTGSTVLLEWTSNSSDCSGFAPGSIADCLASANCNMFCSGGCVTVPFFRTSYMWQCNEASSNGTWANATLTDWSGAYCTGEPFGMTYPVDYCAGQPFSYPPQYGIVMCVPCGDWCPH